jgi:hypothetical protein
MVTDEPPAQEDTMAATAIAETNVVELAPRRARQNMRALVEAKRRHPSHIGAAPARRPQEMCRVLPFRRSAG